MAEEVVQRTLPAEFIEALGQTYADDLTSAIGAIRDVDPATYTGRAFVAPTAAATAEAEALRGGLGAYEPYLQAAQAATGPTAYQQYMSPYQQEIIDTTLSEFDRQTQMGLPQLSAQAIGAGAFGGGREGVQRAEYLSGQARNRAALQAQLLGQNFAQAQQAAANQFSQQMNLAQTAPALVSSRIAGLTALGTQQQAQQQALLEADKQLAYQQAFQPLQTAQQFGAGIAALTPGAYGQTTVANVPAAPSPSALQTGLGTASTLAGIYKVFNPTSPVTINYPGKVA
jgi:hypothetical protein